MTAAPAATPTFSKGLVGIIGAQTELSSVDGQNGILTYRGINIDDLAGRALYEEVVYLLFYGKLPNRDELSGFQRTLAENRQLPDAIRAHILGAPRGTTPMDVLRTAVSALAYYDPETEDISLEATLRKAVRLVAKFPTIVAITHRSQHGQPVVAPDPALGHAANFLYMLHGARQSELENQAMNLYLVLLADHSLNASTFTARVAASTNADLHSAITAAIGALKGNLHGGAAEATMNTLLEIGPIDNVDRFVDRAFETKRKIMGIGHRIYKTGDPRVVHIRKASLDLGQQRGELKWFHILEEVEQAVLKYRQLYANVDFFSSTMLYYIGIPVDMFTPMFAASRIAGWSAHVIEQYYDNVLIRPQSEFIGPMDQHYIPIDERL